MDKLLSFEISRFSFLISKALPERLRH